MDAINQFKLEVYEAYVNSPDVSELLHSFVTSLETHYAPIRFNISLLIDTTVEFTVGTEIESPEVMSFPDSKNIVGKLNSSTHFDNTEVLELLSDIIHKKNTQNIKIYDESFETTMRVLGITFHDMRNTLGSISGIAQLMELDADGNEEITASIKDIISIVSRFDVDATQMMKELRGQPIPYQNSIFDLTEVCNKLLKRNARVYQLSQISLESSVEEGIRCNGDEEKVKEIISELLVNSASALEETGGNVAVSLKQESEKIILSVAHDGSPIKNSVQEYIFIPFFTTKEKARGMGLSRVSRYLKDWGGSITYQSTEAHPVEFVVTLPITL